MIASLPMYDRPETRGAYDRLWTRIRDDLRAAWGAKTPLPETLSHDVNPWDHWQSPVLLLSQTCGLPFRSALHANVTLIGTPDYGLPGCRPGYYNSVLVMNAKDATTDPEGWRNLTLAVNDPRSQSGWAAPLTFMKARGLDFASTLETGSHRNSALAVAKGQADIAAIDAQTWRMIQRWDAFAEVLSEVTRTAETPGLPLITRQPAHLRSLQATIRHHLTNLPAEDASILNTKSLITIAKEDYLAVPTPKIAVK
ncbi:MAG: PhnD/SsuA/transferrin family substrate-binding protein [Boseongicola sp.]|nr:PhnD/SsuA/transferrin family substrate-binding protein [Boseongicola sp.]NNL19046.1 PhnD/SsuA/transferrin family substrate-binding protein [Boseongicola sp.]